MFFSKKKSVPTASGKILCRYLDTKAAWRKNCNYLRRRAQRTRSNHSLTLGPRDMQKAYLTEELGDLNCSGGQKPCPIYGNGHASGVITPGSIRGSVPSFAEWVPAFAGMPEKTPVRGSLPESPSRMVKWTTFWATPIIVPLRPLPAPR